VREAGCARWVLRARGWAAAGFFVCGCSGGTQYIGSNPDPDPDPGPAPGACGVPTSPPAELALDSFYAKYVDAQGIPVVSSASVADAALARACDITQHVVAKREDVRARLIQNGLRVAVIARNELTTDLPEYRDLYSAFPGTDWDRETRGVGATPERPVSSSGEENLLCLGEDRYFGETILVHVVAHGLRRLGIVAVDAGFDARLSAAYESALSSGLWADTYAATDARQYWAEGVQGWYDANQESVRADSVHNHVNTRVELRAYDPELAGLIAEYVPDDDWRPACP